MFRPLSDIFKEEFDTEKIIVADYIIDVQGKKPNIKMYASSTATKEVVRCF
jgi:hypothetical protein